MILIPYCAPYSAVARQGYIGVEGDYLDGYPNLLSYVKNGVGVAPKDTGISLAICHIICMHDLQCCVLI